LFNFAIYFAFSTAPETSSIDNTLFAIFANMILVIPIPLYRSITVVLSLISNIFRAVLYIFSAISKLTCKKDEGLIETFTPHILKFKNLLPFTNLNCLSKIALSVLLLILR